MNKLAELLAAFGSLLGERREAIVEAWLARVTANRQTTSAASVPRVQLIDHIPALLRDFESKLSSVGTAPDPSGADTGQDAAAHGLHRWQQGFPLAEVTRELAFLNECVVETLDNIAQEKRFPHEVMARARRLWAGLHGVAMSESAAEYFRLRQLEAEGEIADLERTLEALKSLEQQRAELWQEAAHDLRGNVGVVATVTAGLVRPTVSAESRAAFLRLLDRNVRAVRGLLDDVTSLARLQGGHEHRELAAIDVAELFGELGDALQPAADEHLLYLRCEGASPFLVDGDAVKIRRMAQNLILNGLKYTTAGGVTLRWREVQPARQNDPQRWLFEVEDTGPGFHAGPGSPLQDPLKAATSHSRAVSDDDTLIESPSHGLAGAPANGRPQSAGGERSSGEGIGLSIVKRLCDLLDGSIELDSDRTGGTRFRIVLPRSYPTQNGNSP